MATSIQALNYSGGSDDGFSVHSLCSGPVYTGGSGDGFDVVDVEVPIVYDRYWVSSDPGDWNDPTNWGTTSGGAGGASVPVSTHTVLFDGANNSTGPVTIDMTVEVVTLTISDLYIGTITSGGYAVTVSSNFNQSAGTIRLGTSVFTLEGDFLKTGGTFDAGTSTLAFTGGKTQTLTPGGTSFYHVRVNKTGGSLTLGGDVDVRGNLTLEGGTFDSSSGNYAIQLAGDWNKSGGSFEANSSTLTLSNTDAGQTVDLDGSSVFALISSNTSSGGVTFTSSFTASLLYINAAELASSATMYFASNSTFTISTFTVQGTESDHVVLKPETASTHWYLNNVDKNTVSYTEVEYSSASAGIEVVNAGGFNLGNNFNWTFPEIGTLALGTNAVYNPSGDGLTPGSESLVAAFTLTAGTEDQTFDQTLTFRFTAVGGADLGSDFTGFQVYKESNGSADGWDGSDLALKDSAGTVASVASFLPTQNNTISSGAGAITYYVTVTPAAGIAIQEGIRVSMNEGDLKSTGDTSTGEILNTGTFTGNDIVAPGLVEQSEASALRLGLDRHTFFDGSAHWMFYIDDNADVVYSTSSAGGIWATPVVVDAGTYNSLGIWEDGTSVYVTYSDGTNAYIRKITIATHSVGGETTLTTDAPSHLQPIKSATGTLWRKGERR